jgi:nitrate reductase NapE component
MMTIIVILLILNFALLGALGFAVWVIARNDLKPLEPPEVFGEVWKDAK